MGKGISPMSSLFGQAKKKVYHKFLPSIRYSLLPICSLAGLACSSSTLSQFPLALLPVSCMC
jgi:hypothetical protein